MCDQQHFVRKREVQAGRYFRLLVSSRGSSIRPANPFGTGPQTLGERPPSILRSVSAQISTLLHFTLTGTSGGSRTHTTFRSLDPKSRAYCQFRHTRIRGQDRPVATPTQWPSATVTGMRIPVPPAKVSLPVAYGERVCFPRCCFNLCVSGGIRTLTIFRLLGPEPSACCQFRHTDIREDAPTRLLPTLHLDLHCTRTNLPAISPVENGFETDSCRCWVPHTRYRRRELNPYDLAIRGF
jgi:hypothetical protein